MQRTNLRIYSFLVLTLIAVTFMSFSASAEPWTPQQLLEPSELNKTLNNPKAPQPKVYCIGPQALIKNSIDIGPGYDQENVNKLKKQLKNVPKDANIVIYCGCCPFERCPNVRPVFKMLNEMGFKNHKLLNLKQNIKTDWIDKGYAIKK